jgi:hypothetical protein
MTASRMFRISDLDPGRSFAQELELLKIDDRDPAAGGTNDTAFLKATDNPDRGFYRRAGHIGKLLACEMQGRTHPGKKHQKSIGKALLYPFHSQVSQASLRLSQTPTEDADNLQSYLGPVRQKSQESLPFNAHNLRFQGSLG